MSLEFAVGDKTRMRTLAGEDAQELFALIDRNRSHLRPWMSWLDATTCVDDVRTFIQSAQDLTAKNRKGMHPARAQKTHVVGGNGKSQLRGSRAANNAYT